MPSSAALHSKPFAGQLAALRVAVIGGGGFVGRHVAQALVGAGAVLSIACRRPERAHALRSLGDPGQVAFATVDVTRPDTLAPVIAQADAVVYMAGAFAGDLDAIQGRGVGRVAAMAAQAGVRAFVHVSALGGDAASPYAYARTKAQGEAAVMETYAKATILRPSVIFGPDDAFLNMFARLMVLAPVLPVFGPDAVMQPVLVDDVAQAVVAALVDPVAHGGRRYALGGPEVVTMMQLNQRIAAACHRHPWLLPMPDGLARVIAALPGTPITPDQYALLLAGSTVPPGEPDLAALGLTARPMGLYLDRWMARYRPKGRV
ncbi:NAD(P)H-binding protein [Novosphingobium sp. FSY-8]|uniref:NAD(P)H-binding protein n=1 Tax=Novosphingobium ovatum TaxID=1908523 RepID=A0ABW9XH70_9SPHN|nr:complex I NDUFA9 subunit family protein [Novosphingobium ovatum]NBC37908.1 NAD(P)H-binding protein [Novosphingobium ovatum]